MHRSIRQRDPRRVAGGGPRRSRCLRAAAVCLLAPRGRVAAPADTDDERAERRQARRFQPRLPGVHDLSARGARVLRVAALRCRDLPDAQVHRARPPRERLQRRPDQAQPDRYRMRDGRCHRPVPQGRLGICDLSPLRRDGRQLRGRLCRGDGRRADRDRFHVPLGAHRQVQPAAGNRGGTGSGGCFWTMMDLRVLCRTGSHRPCRRAWN